MTLATRRSSPPVTTTATAPASESERGSGAGFDDGAQGPPPAAPLHTRHAYPLYERRPAGAPYVYRGYTIVPVHETLRSARGGARTPAKRTRWDVLEALQVPGAEPLLSRRKTCASQITAEGWVDAYGDAAKG